jgi:photosystem II stability/assembly factor-like uncharacterized protein
MTTSQQEIYVGSGRRIFHSTDAGSTWRDTGFRVRDRIRYGLVLALAEADGVLLAGTHDGIYRSADAGHSWQFSRLDPASFERTVSTIAVSGNTVLVGTPKNGVYRSDDGGITWSRTPLLSGGFSAILIKGATIYAGGGIGLAVSVDDGVTWRDASRAIDNAGSVVHLASTDGGVLAIFDNGDLWRVEENGVSWAYQSTIPERVTSLVRVADTLYAATKSGTSGSVYRSDDDGVSWEPTSLTGWPLEDMTATADSLIACGPGVFQSFNAGGSWIQLAVPSQEIQALAMDDDLIFAGTAGGLYVSDDVGVSWMRLTGPWRNVTMFAVVDGAVYAQLDAPAGITRFTHDANGWSSTVIPGFGFPVASPTALYRARDILSPDDWEYLSGSTSSVSSKPITVDPHFAFHGDTLYMAARLGRPGSHVRRLDESTMAWSILPNFEPRGGGNARVMDIAILDGAVYAASDAVWTSADGGSTWYRLTFGLGHLGVWSLTTVGASVFASTAAGPVFRLTPPSETWIAVSPAIPYEPGLNARWVDTRWLHSHGDALFSVTDTHTIEMARPEVGFRAADVNHDGVVDIVDLIIVARDFGVVGLGLDGDTDGDGRVTIADLVKVAAAFGTGPDIAAPARLHSVDEWPPLREWLALARESHDGTVQWGRGVEVLKLLAAAMVPPAGQVFAPYPNPLNPATWIPFALAEAGEVTMTVYDARGQRIRQLHLGYRPAGAHYAKNRAAHWDGRNDSGEAVASGVYVVELTAPGLRQLHRLVLAR